VKRLAAPLVLILASILALACDDNPAQPEPLTDCSILGVIVPRTLDVGQTVRLSAFLDHCRPMYLPLDPAMVAWQSLDPAVASVSADTLTGVARGPAVVQGAYGNMTQQALVIVGGNLPQPGTPVQMRLRIYGAPIMSVQQRAAFGAFAVLADGTVARVSSAATWESSRPSVAALSGVTGDGADRAVDALRAGAARITAGYQGSSAEMMIEVRN
jgi:hypothetical protein